jgi:hypothetical protein
MHAGAERVKFAISVAEMMVVYILPQLVGLYLFSRLFGV